jgi:hypothetical protein
MLMLRRFRAMARIPLDLRRWPDEVRAAALAHIEADPQARVILDDERTLDSAMETAGQRFDATLRQPSDAVTLARLRGGVAARIATTCPAERPHWTPPRCLHWFGRTTGHGLAIAAGLVIGTLYAPPPGNDALLALLQPTPLRMLAH